MNRITIKSEELPTDNVGEIKAGDVGYIAVIGVFIKNKSKELIFTPYYKDFVFASDVKLSELRKDKDIGYQKLGVNTSFTEKN